MDDKKTATAGAEITTSDKNKSAGASSGKKLTLEIIFPVILKLCIIVKSNRLDEIVVMLSGVKCRFTMLNRKGGIRPMNDTA